MHDLYRATVPVIIDQAPVENWMIEKAKEALRLRVGLTQVVIDLERQDMILVQFNFPADPGEAPRIARNIGTDVVNILQSVDAAIEGISVLPVDDIFEW